MTTLRGWSDEAVRRIEADFNRSADTHLFKLDLPALAGVDVYFKDESTHPTGSLKHRLARSLFLYAICNGWVQKGTTVIEASSGSTAVSEAYFARLLELPFIAVMPRDTSAEKVAAIEFYGGRCHFDARPACGLVDNATTLPTTPQPQQQPKRTSNVLRKPDILMCHWQFRPRIWRDGGNVLS